MLVAQADMKRQTMSRPLRQALSSKLDSAATLSGGTGSGKPQFFESEEWRDATYRRTHIDYRTLKRGKGSHSLHDLQASTISMPLQNPENASKGATSSVVAGQGSHGGGRTDLSLAAGRGQTSSSADASSGLGAGSGIALAVTVSAVASEIGS